MYLAKAVGRFSAVSKREKVSLFYTYYSHFI